MLPEKIEKLFRKTTLYIVRVDLNGNLKDSAPCHDCLKVIKSLNIKKIVFSSVNKSFLAYKPDDYNATHESHGRKYLNSKI